MIFPSFKVKNIMQALISAPICNITLLPVCIPFGMHVSDLIASTVWKLSFCYDMVLISLLQWYVRKDMFCSSVKIPRLYC